MDFLFTKAQLNQLFKNGSDPDKDHSPVVRLFLTNSECTWLISELYIDKPGLAFGLCDLGLGFPELGYCFFDELQELEMPGEGNRLGADGQFHGKFPMSAYAAAARKHGRVIIDASVVKAYSAKPSPQ